MANEKQTQKENLDTLLDLLGKVVGEGYKMFVRNVVAQGVILLLIALLLCGAAALLALGVVLPVWSWILLGLAIIPLIWGILLLANPTYHALEDIYTRIKEK